MTMRKWILLGLLVPAVGLLVGQVLWPSEWLEYACLLVALPIVVVNAWEWSMPEVMEFYFGKGKKKRAASSATK
jgi:hypothetical protein